MAEIMNQKREEEKHAKPKLSRKRKFHEISSDRSDQWSMSLSADAELQPPLQETSLMCKKKKRNTKATQIVNANSSEEENSESSAD